MANTWEDTKAALLCNVIKLISDSAISNKEKLELVSQTMVCWKSDEIDMKMLFNIGVQLNTDMGLIFKQKKRRG